MDNNLNNLFLKDIMSTEKSTDQMMVGVKVHQEARTGIVMEIAPVLKLHSAPNRIPSTFLASGLGLQMASFLSCAFSENK